MLQAMLNRLTDIGDVKPLHRYRKDPPQTIFGSTPFLTDASGLFRGASRGGQRGQFQRPTQLVLPAEEGSSSIVAAEKVSSRAFMDSAIVFTTHAVRYGLFYGDDGKSVTVRCLLSQAMHLCSLRNRGLS